jgi:hypothetical protein
VNNYKIFQEGIATFIQFPILARWNLKMIQHDMQEALIFENSSFR